MGPDPRQTRELRVRTPRGELLFRSLCQPGSFLGLRLDCGLGNFPHYSSMIQKLEMFECIASGEDGNVLLTLANGNNVVAYACCYYPSAGERWAALGKLMYEMGAIEVSRNWRNLGIAQILVRMAMDRDFYEDKIAYMNGFSWHWDLEGTGYTLAQYRQMMINLMKPYGFKEYPTNEPNIAIREENVFLARIGSRVSQRDVLRFRKLLFGIVDKN
ncbi:MAG: GNAT family N-acetyltransferase [bacterium]